MKEHECIIGILYGNDDSILITLENLKEEIEYVKSYNFRLKKGQEQFKKKEYSLKDYFDGRKSTDVYMFKYCPVCGKKIEKVDD